MLEQPYIVNLMMQLPPNKDRKHLLGVVQTSLKEFKEKCESEGMSIIIPANMKLNESFEGKSQGSLSVNSSSSFHTLPHAKNEDSESSDNDEFPSIVNPSEVYKKYQNMGTLEIIEYLKKKQTTSQTSGIKKKRKNNRSSATPLNFSSSTCKKISNLSEMKLGLGKSILPQSMISPSLST